MLPLVTKNSKNAAGSTAKCTLALEHNLSYSLITFHDTLKKTELLDELQGLVDQSHQIRENHSFKLDTKQIEEKYNFVMHDAKYRYPKHEQFFDTLRGLDREKWTTIKDSPYESLRKSTEQFEQMFKPWIHW